MDSKTATFLDDTHTGFRWEVSGTEPIPKTILRWMGQSTYEAANTARKLRTAGWTVEVLTPCPGSKTIKEAATRWTCRGAVRGDCGKTHQTNDAAERCCAADSRAIDRGMKAGRLGSGSYSDRHPVVVA